MQAIVQLTSPAKTDSVKQSLVALGCWVEVFNHCQNEMPKLVKFVEGMDKDKVQLIGVRTSVEREQMSYSDFKAQYKPNFPIYTDATMSLAFGKFARDEQTVASMPKIAILDRKGTVQFILENNTFEDPIEQIQWALEEVSQF